MGPGDHHEEALNGCTVSVVVPVYNMERYLEQCLDSLRSQNLEGLEIICVDDGSRDSSPEILRRYAESDSRFRIITKENSGYGATMNIGIAASTGEYVGIVEPDDFVEPGMFEFLYRNAKAHDLDISRCTFFYHDEATGEDTPERYPFVIKDRVYAPRDKPETFYQQPADWVNIYRRSFLVDNGITFLETPGASFQDTSFLFKAYVKADRYLISDRPLYHYRQTESSSCRQKTSKLYYLCGEYEEIWRFIEAEGVYDRYKHILTQIQYYGYKWNCMRLEEEYRMEFIRQWSEDFKKLEERGLIRRFDYLPSDYRILRNVLRNAGRFTTSAEFGLIDSKDKNTRRKTSRFGFLARWFARIRS